MVKMNLDNFGASIYRGTPTWTNMNRLSVLLTDPTVEATITLSNIKLTRTGIYARMRARTRMHAHAHGRKRMHTHAQTHARLHTHSGESISKTLQLECLKNSTARFRAELNAEQKRLAHEVKGLPPSTRTHAWTHVFIDARMSADIHSRQQMPAPTCAGMEWLDQMLACACRRC